MSKMLYHFVPPIRKTGKKKKEREDAVISTKNKKRSEKDHARKTKSKRGSTTMATKAMIDEIVHHLQRDANPLPPLITTVVVNTRIIVVLFVNIAADDKILYHWWM